MGKKLDSHFVDDNLRLGKRSTVQVEQGSDEEATTLNEKRMFEDRYGKRSPFQDSLRMGKRQYYDNDTWKYLMARFRSFLSSIYGQTAQETNVKRNQNRQLESIVRLG